MLDSDHEVVFCAEADAELAELPEQEQLALLAAVEKLWVVGDRLPYPHSSAVRSGHSGRSSRRPKGGRSTWRAFDCRVGDRLVIAAIGLEAKHEHHKFIRPARAT